MSSEGARAKRAAASGAGCRGHAASARRGSIPATPRNAASGIVRRFRGLLPPKTGAPASLHKFAFQNQKFGRSLNPPRRVPVLISPEQRRSFNRSLQTETSFVCRDKRGFLLLSAPFGIIIPMDRNPGRRSIDGQKSDDGCARPRGA